METKSDRREARRQAQRRRIPQHGKRSLMLVAAILVAKGKKTT